MNPTKKVKIGEAIRNQRKNQGLTLNELGQRMGISGSLVGQYERGVVNPKYETIIRFADALNVVPRVILGNAFMDVISPEVERLAHSVYDTTDIRLYLSGRVVPVTIQERLIEAFSELNKEGQKVAVERVKELTQIPKYQKDPAGDSTQSAGAGDEKDPE